MDGHITTGNETSRAAVGRRAVYDLFTGAANPRVCAGGGQIVQRETARASG